MVNYLILSLVESHEEHVHVLKTCCLGVELRLEDAVVHEIDPCYASYHLRLLASIVPLVMNASDVLNHGVVHKLHVGQSRVPATANSSVLIKRVGFVDSCLARNRLVHHILGNRPSCIHLSGLLISLGHGIGVSGAYTSAARRGSLTI